MDVKKEHESGESLQGGLPCPVCGEPTTSQAPVRSSRRRRRGFVGVFSELFYHQRYCRVCAISFEVSALEDFLWRHFPLLLSSKSSQLEEGRKIYLPETRPIHSGELHLPAHLTARAEQGPNGETAVIAPADRSSSPISIDPVNRTVSISLACVIAEGDFADQMSRAIQSLEKNMRQAADQIHLLSEATEKLGLGSPPSEESAIPVPKEVREREPMPFYYNAHQHYRKKFRRHKRR